MLYVAWLSIIDPALNQQIRPAHLAYLNELYKKGQVVMAGPFPDGSGGLVIYRANSEDEARKLAEQDPVVAQKARTLTLKTWSPLDFPLAQ